MHVKGCVAWNSIIFFSLISKNKKAFKSLEIDWLIGVYCYLSILMLSAKFSNVSNSNRIMQQFHGFCVSFQSVEKFRHILLSVSAIAMIIVNVLQVRLLVYYDCS